MCLAVELNLFHYCDFCPFPPAPSKIQCVKVKLILFEISDCPMLWLGYLSYNLQWLRVLLLSQRLFTLAAISLHYTEVCALPLDNKHNLNCHILSKLPFIHEDNHQRAPKTFKLRTWSSYIIKVL
jgi:hypothetical protein